ncbi:hypothetical protein NL533_35990, partial [Klebsiella pneumoniae]|nr:hypothetical protein [Klebsiella pneumoniae]
GKCFSRASRMVGDGKKKGSSGDRQSIGKKDRQLAGPQEANQSGDQAEAKQGLLVNTRTKKSQ